MLDLDLARIYGVPTKAPNRAVKRNQDRIRRSMFGVCLLPDLFTNRRSCRGD